MTKAELLAGQVQIPALRAELETVRTGKDRLSRREQELRRTLSHLEEPDEVFEGQPIRAWGTTNFGAQECGDDGSYRQAYVNPIDPSDDEISEDPEVPIPYRGWLLKLSGAADNKTEREWKRYPVDGRDQAVLAAKRFAAHGVVPEPDALKEEEPKRAHPLMEVRSVFPVSQGELVMGADWSTRGDPLMEAPNPFHTADTLLVLPLFEPAHDLTQLAVKTIGTLEYDADASRLEAEGRADWELSLNLAKAKLADVQARLLIERNAVDELSPLLRQLWAERGKLNAEIAKLESQNPGG